MNNTIWPHQLYWFLRQIVSREDGQDGGKRSILDCGVGGDRPPLALFDSYGLDCHGIDIDPDRLARARAFGAKYDVAMNLVEGDMRDIPFEDDYFDYVYEYNSICHLSKSDTGIAIAEMHRVLKPGGMAFTGFMSSDTWPIEGTEQAPGEFRLVEGDANVLHSAFCDSEPEGLLTPFTIQEQQTVISRYPERLRNTDIEEWMSWYQDDCMTVSRETWEEWYHRRFERSRYSHMFYLLKKL